MKKIALLALLLLLPFAGRALAQDPGCDCPTCITALAAAEEQAQAQAQAEEVAAVTRVTSEAQLLERWGQLTEANTRLGLLRSEIARLEGELGRLANQFESKVGAPAMGKSVLKPVMGTAPVVPQCGSSCAETLRAQFDGGAAPANAVRATAPVMPQCGSSCAETLRAQFGENTQVKAVQATEPVMPQCDTGCASELRQTFADSSKSCDGGACATSCDEASKVQVKKVEGDACGSSCGTDCDAAAKVQVKKVADESCGSCGSCTGCDEVAKVQVKKVVDDACSDCSDCTGCDAAAKVQVKKVADESCGSCGSCDAVQTQVVKAYDSRGLAADGCPHSAVAGMCEMSLGRSLAVADARFARIQSSIARAEVRLRSLKTEVAMAKLGSSFSPAAQQVKALSSSSADCIGDCQGCDGGTCPATQVKATSDCGGCDAAATQVKAEKVMDCGSECGTECCGGCDAAATQVKAQTSTECGSGCCESAEAVQVKKVEAAEPCCGGCDAKP